MRVGIEASFEGTKHWDKMKQGMHNGNDGWLTHRLMSVLFFVLPSL